MNTQKGLLVILFLFTISNVGRAQNTFPTNDHVTLDGYTIRAIQPVTTGGWARGFVYRTLADDANTAGIGLYGNSTSIERLYFAHGTSPWSSGKGLYVIPSGNVGIGTTNPTSKLDVSGSFTHSSTLRSRGSTYTSTWMQFNEDQYGNSLILGGGGLTAIGSGESANHIRNNVSAGTETLHLSSDNGLRVTTNLQSGWASRVTALEIENNGNIGIGTTTAATNLHISAGTSGDGILRLESDTDNNNEGDNSRIELLQDGGSLGAYIGYNQDWVGATQPDNVFRIVPRRLNTDDESAFVIKTTGTTGNISSFMGVGTADPDEKLTVAGTVKSKEVIVEENAGADFVFEEGYDLPTLANIEQFIKANKHLEGIPSAEEMKANGVKVGELQIKLLQKIEELTLYAIEQEKRDQQKDKVIEELLKRIEQLEKKEK